MNNETTPTEFKDRLIKLTLDSLNNKHLRVILNTLEAAAKKGQWYRDFEYCNMNEFFTPMVIKKLTEDYRLVVTASALDKKTGVYNDVTISWE